MIPTIDLEPLRSGIEDFLPLLVLFFIWWISSRRTGKSRPPIEGQIQGQSSRQAPPPIEPNGAEEINPIDVLRQMLFGGMEMPSVQAPQTAPIAAPGPTDAGESYQGVTGDTTEQALPTALATRVVAAVPKQEKERAVIHKVSPPPTPNQKPAETLFLMGQLSRRELQRAIIWSEVLALPVGLRDEARQQLTATTSLYHTHLPPL